MDYHVWGAMLEAYYKLHPQSKSITELKEACDASFSSVGQPATGTDQQGC